ncbi:MAG: 3-dehydroquinate synthase [Gemmatimonadota bacterium]
MSEAPAGDRLRDGFSLVEVGTERDGYPIVIGRSVLNALPALVARHAPASRYAVISDSTVAPLYGADTARRLREAGMPAQLFTFPAGEEEKNRRTWGALTDAMLAAGFGRDSVVIAVGGGVTGDLAGFVAATYMRGVPVVQVPTSLVAMVDASVGGKTGVDVPDGKNLVGAFHPPRLVAVDPDVIGSLPRAERANGMAEAVKHGAILDADYFDWIDRAAPEILEGEADAVLRTVLRSIALKAEIVSRDEREGGVRRILNFGHTVGHALEASSGYALPHGAAVALGMILETGLGEQVGVTADGTSERLKRVLGRLELPVTPSSSLETDEVLHFMKSDKKSVEGVPRFVLLSGIGQVDQGAGWVHAVPQGIVNEALLSFAAAARGSL